jgi:hypothetical protein
LSIARQQRLAERLHWGGVLVLSVASVLGINSAIELAKEPEPHSALVLIAELIVIAFDLMLHLGVHYLKQEVDNRKSLLIFELEVKGDELRQLATTLGLDVQRYLR